MKPTSQSMRLAHIAAAFLCCIAVAGCSVSRAVKEGGPLPGHAVNPQESVKILNVIDGQESGQASAAGSGAGMVASLRKALTSHNIRITTTQSTDVNVALQEASTDGSGYVLRCVITLWEDNATAWSGNGDKLNISLELYETRTRQIVAASTFERTATGATLVSGTPARFMDEDAVGALARIYGWPAK